MESDSPYRRIMVPLDGSASAEACLPWALAFADREGVTLDLVGVISPSAFPPPRNPREETKVKGWFAEEEERVTSYLRRIEGRLSGVKARVRTHARRGQVVETLLEWSRTLETDLAIMSTHGRGGLRRAWLGSVADELIRAAPWPVLLNRATDETAPPEPARMRRILVPLDGSNRAEVVLADGVRLARHFGATLSLVSILPTPVFPGRSHVAYGIAEGDDTTTMLRGLRDYLEGMAKGIREEGIEVEVEATEAPGAAEGILDRLAETGADLVMVATRGRGGVARFALGSVADKLIRGSTRPVLVHRVSEDLE